MSERTAPHAAERILAGGERVDAAERVCWLCGVMKHKPQRNERGQPVGWPVEGWSPRPRPPRTPMIGRFATVEPLAIRDNAQGQAVGVAVYQNSVPAMRTIEIGGLVFSPWLQRRPAATEAMYLTMRRVFDELGYRRYEWKCDFLEPAVARRCGPDRLSV